MKRIIYITVGLIIIGGMFVSICSAQEASSDERKTSNGANGEGITVGGECLNGVGKGCFRYEEIVGINNESKKYTALSIVQDVIYAAGYMVGTVLTAVIIWCGLGYIIASRGGKDTNAYKKGLENGAIGAILVLGAYAIVRLIQYIAKGG